jgi:tetrapyrrole methylase family protein/MazG family protein
MSATLSILGLGPGNPDQRTVEAVEVLSTASRILLRTGIHPGVNDLLGDPRVSTCDDIYESGRTFDEVYAAIVERVIAQVSNGDLVFAVPGHPLIGERTVIALLDRAEASAIPVRIVAGVSALDVVSSALRIDPMAQQAQIVDATELEHFIEREPFNGGLPDVSPLRPVLVTQVYSPAVASAVKLALSKIFPDAHPIVVATAVGVCGEERIEHVALYELDRVAVDHLTSVWVPPLEELSATRGPLTLHRIAAHLRSPEGCPWDRKQTYSSLRSSAIEEAYEVAAAIDDNDPDHLAEELGDLLLHVAMQAQIGEELGDFSIGDILDQVNRKLVRRHPHVFGSVAAETPEAVVQTWNEIKANERAAKGLETESIPPFDRLPKSMPVLSRLAQVMKSDARFDHAGRDLGGELLAKVQQVVDAGLDPEVELERAYRRRSSAFGTIE